MEHGPGKWRQLSSKLVHQNLFYSVREDSVVRPDGSEGAYYVVDLRGATFTVAVDDEQRVCLVRLHRYPIDEYSVEVPGGGMEEGEEPLTGAKRELEEETGITAATWKLLGNTHPAPGMIAENNFMFLATDLTLASEHAQAEEGITEVLKVSFADAFAMVRDGQITNQQTVTALTLAAIELGLISR